MNSLTVPPRSSFAPFGAPNLTAPRRISPVPGAAVEITVMIVDDHPVVRKGLAACLARMENVRVVGEAQNGAEALRRSQELNPDLVLLDIDMPHTSGLAVVEQFKLRAPRAKVIFLTMHDRSEFVLRAIQAGARGYMLKGSSAQEIGEAIRIVHAGGCFFSKEVTNVALNHFVRGQAPSDETQLTSREREVLVQIAEGLSNKEIAQLLDIGVRTVETHRERIMRKLNIHATAGLTRYAIMRGLVAVQMPMRN